MSENINPDNERSAKTSKGRPSLNDLLFINTSVFNIALPLILALIIRTVPQVNHIVFGQMEGNHLILPTALVVVFTLLMMSVYFYQRSKVEGNIPAPVFTWVNLVSFLLPSMIWIISISVNGKQILLALVLSLLFCVTGPVMIMFSQINKNKINKQSVGSFLADNAEKIIVFVMLLCTMIFFINAYSYEKNDPIIQLLPCFLIVSIILTLLIISLIKSSKNDLNLLKNSTELNRKEKSYLIALHIAIIIMVIMMFYLYASGNSKFLTNAFSILLFYFLCLRLLLFGASYFLIFGLHSINRLKSFSSYAFVFIIFILIIIYSSRPSISRKHLNLNVESKTSQRPDFDAFVSHWFASGDTSTRTPVFLISGQGGGSRAGCAFFTTLSLLDSTLGQNLILITTVSGSSNGAGFYLSAKKALPANQTYQDHLRYTDSVKLLTIDSILYQKDYITTSLFKLLFTDYTRSIFGSPDSTKSRNISLMNEEKESFFKLRDYLKLDPITILDSTWGSVYQSNAGSNFPLFLPMTYNIEKGIKAISSPVQLPHDNMHPFFDVLESLGDHRDLQINRSILLSQLFPVLSASASIDTFHYLDGGVYDNLAFETLFDLYQAVAKIRDSLASNRPIILISIENSDYDKDKKFTDIRSELNATSGAVVQSLFSSNPMVHKTMGFKSLQKRDTFFDLKIYHNDTTEQKSWTNFFKYTPDKDKVVLTRYLTMEDIKINIIRTAYREVDAFKIKLNQFIKDTSVVKVK